MKSKNLVEYVLNQWPENFTRSFSYAVGLSGGIDSVVLLHIMHKIAKIKKLNLCAIHINHGISPNAKEWQHFCQDLCAKLAITLTTKQYQITKSGGESLENNARSARYKTFFAHQANVIVLAHHLNDQLETTLSQIFRGSDLHNVAGMELLSNKQGKLFWRPLLGITRGEIETYAKENNLITIEDESNTDTKYLRNFLRHKIIPELVNYDSHIDKKIVHFINQLQNTLKLIDEIAQSDLINSATIIKDKQVINLELLKQLSQTRQTNLITYFIKQHNIALPSTRQIKEFIRQAINSEWDKKPQLKLTNSTQIWKHKDKIYITS